MGQFKVGSLFVDFSSGRLWCLKSSFTKQIYKILVYKSVYISYLPCMEAWSRDQEVYFCMFE